jgi:hypothetical protein
MRKSTEKRTTVFKTALAGAAMLLAMAGPTWAAVAEHANIVLKNYAGVPITDLTGEVQLQNSLSVQQTCFGTAGCHGDATKTNNLKFTYNDIEQHNYHTQVANNEYKGFNYWNPDDRGPQSSLITGAGPKGKNWVQGQGHMGAW